MKIVFLFIMLYAGGGFAQSSTNVIKVTSLSKDTTAKPVVIKMNCGPSKLLAKPLIILNGIVLADSLLSKVNPSQIQSIDILKDATATAQFGEQGKNGVIIIHAKPELIDELTNKGVIKPIL